MDYSFVREGRNTARLFNDGESSPFLPGWNLPGFGLLLIAEHVWEIFFYDTPRWRAAAAAIYQALV